MCKHLETQPLSNASPRMVQFLEQARASTTGSKETIEKFLEASSYLKAKGGNNRKYRVLIYHCDLPLMQRMQRFIKLESSLDKKQLRVVITIQGEIVRVQEETR